MAARSDRGFPLHGLSDNTAGYGQRHKELTIIVRMPCHETNEHQIKHQQNQAENFGKGEDDVQDLVEFAVSVCPSHCPMIA